MRSRTSPASMSTAALQAELARRQRALPRLQHRHSRLVAQARQVADQIASLGGEARAPARARRAGRRGQGRGGQNKQTLVQALSALLRGRTMRVIEAADAVRAAGYRTSSRNFRTQVGIALSKGPFRRTGRGKYTTSGSPAAAAAGRAPRPGKKASLLQALMSVVKDKTVSVTDAVAAVKSAGYKSKSKTFYHAVATTLARSGKFSRVGRGMYKAK